MKASVSPRLVAIGLFAVCGTVIAQDAIILTDKQRREGQIVSVSNGNIRIKIGPAETGVPLTTVASVSMQPPKDFNASMAAWQSGDAAKTVTLVKPLVDSFRGLPTTWAERASSLLGDAYLAQGKTAEAETAYSDFTKAYPKSASLANLGMARLAIEKKDYSAAKSKLEGIVAESNSTKIAESGKNATYGQALYLMGQVLEAEGATSEAMRDYLLAATLFREDKTASTKAQERADALKTKNIIVP